MSSTTVTFAPSRRHTDPSSRPITPPPMTTRCCRDLGNHQRARVREHALLVELEERELDRDGARRDDDVLRLDLRRHRRR